MPILPMSKIVTFKYYAEIERDEDDWYSLTFPDFGWRRTGEESIVNVLLDSKDFLKELIETTLRESKELPKTEHRSYYLVESSSIAIEEIQEEKQINCLKDLNPILRWFHYSPLPDPSLEEMAKKFHDLAIDVVKRSPSTDEQAAGLRKLLEARDCIVRNEHAAIVKEEEKND